MRIVFMGTPGFAVPALHALLNEHYQVVGVVTRPDRPRGRGQKTNPCAVKETALNSGLPVFQPLQLNEPEFIRQLEHLSCDVIVVIAFGQILPPAVLSLPRWGCVNVHASLLPEYRGAAPIHRAVINGETRTGVTTMLMDKGLDTGDILLQEILPIQESDTTGALHDRLAGMGAKLLVKTLYLLTGGKLVPQSQDHSRATYAHPLLPEDEVIRWDSPARNIFNHVRGMNPWPGAFTFWEGKLLKIWQVEALKHDSLQAGILPGQVQVSGSDDGLVVQAKPGLVAIKELQLQGGKRLPVADFLRGHPVPAGTILA
jgi:methionyl-tRNA formyltransferase